MLVSDGGGTDAGVHPVPALSHAVQRPGSHVHPLQHGALAHQRASHRTIVVVSGGRA